MLGNQAAHVTVVGCAQGVEPARQAQLPPARGRSRVPARADCRPAPLGLLHDAHLLERGELIGAAQ
jgi:hypothetical protein